MFTKDEKARREIEYLKDRISNIEIFNNTLLAAIEKHQEMFELQNKINSQK